MGAETRTIRHHVDRRAAEQPDAPFLIAPETGAVLTYGGLRRASLELGGCLDAVGVGKGEKVALMLRNGYQTARLLIGTMYAGRTVVPLNLLAQSSQLEYVLDHSDARLVFTSDELQPRVAAALARVRRPVELAVIDPDATVIPSRAAGAPAALPDVSEADDALLMYTSGTTGLPKGVLHTHRSVVAGGEFTSSAHRLSAADRVMCSLPLYHINGQIVTAVAPLVHGGSVVMPHRFSVSSYWDTVARHGCTWINLVPTLINYLVNAPDPRSRGLDLGRVKFCRSASAPLPPELHAAFEARFNVSIIETFGMTETCAPCFTNPYESARRKIGSPGCAYGNEAKIVDPGSGRELPAGAVGEIMVRGENLMKCYYKDAAATAAAFDDQGWMRSGDLGYLDEDGFLFVTGRLKELIIKGGENIAPREIDEALQRHPAVLEAAAVGMPDPVYGQNILACVVLKPDAACSAAELLDFSRRELGPYKTPKVVKFLEALPKGPSGKVQRLKLLELV
jgi:long-chain acyl-CoA synthetase